MDESILKKFETSVVFKQKVLKVINFVKDKQVYILFLRLMTYKIILKMCTQFSHKIISVLQNLNYLPLKTSK